LLAGAHAAAAVLGAGGDDGAQFLAPDVGPQRQVDEAGPGDVDLHHHVVGGQRRGDGVGELARLLAGVLGEHHGSVGRHVAVRGVLRRLDDDAPKVGARRQRRGDRAHAREHVGKQVLGSVLRRGRAGHSAERVVEIPWRVKAPPQDCPIGDAIGRAPKPAGFCSMPLARRTFLLAAATLPFGHVRAAPKRDALRVAERSIADLERKAGGRLGVFVRDSGTGAALAHRARERFPLCSTFKVLAAAAVLKQVDDGKATLDQAIAYGQADLLDYAPETKKHVAEGHMSLGDLCAAAIQWSDNTAGNLILKQIGGPAGFTHYAHSIGDKITRLDRTEPTLNTAIPGDPRDTTTPEAIVRTLQTVLAKGA